MQLRALSYSESSRCMPAGGEGLGFTHSLDSDAVSRVLYPPRTMNELEPTTDDRREIETAALRLLRENRRRARHPGDGRLLRYTCPSPGHYPFQWFWDSCFHTIALAHLEPDVAREELELLVSVQPRSGFLPHVIFWD